MKKKTIITAILSICVIAGVVYWVSQRDGANKETIKIGAILPLTGKASFVGKPIKNAIQLFIEEHQQKMEQEIEVIFEDSGADKNKALSILQKFKTQNISLIIGPVTSGEVLSLASEAERYGMVLLSPGASASSITDAGDHIFRNELSDNLGAKKQAQLAIEDLEWKRVSVIYTNNEYGVGVVNNFETEYTRLGGEIATKVAFESGSKDFRTQIAIIKRNPSDALFIVAQDEYPNIVRKLRENGVEVPIYATPVFENEEFIRQLGNLSEGIIYTYYGVFDSHSSEKKCRAFVRNYEANYQMAPSYYAALGYDSIGLLTEALRLSSYNQSEVKDILYTIKKYQGVTGEISFDENGDVYKPVILKKVINGFFRIVE